MIRSAPIRGLGNGFRFGEIPRAQRSPRTLRRLGHRRLGAVNTTGIITGVAGNVAEVVAGPIGQAAVEAVGAIVGALLAGHNQRMAEAKNENAAVNNGVAGFDSGVQQIVAAYNSGQLGSGQTAVQNAIQLFNTILSDYWQEVTPVIQPGRNGCSGGSACPAISATGSNPSTGIYSVGQIGYTYCSGNIGAACCVGCVNLAPAVQNLIAAVTEAGQTGQPAVGYVYAVQPSSYGTSGRGAYSVTFTPPASPTLSSSTSGIATDIESTSVAGIPVLVLAGVAALLAFAL